MRGVRILCGLVISLFILNLAIIGVDASPGAGMYVDPERITGTEESHFTIDIIVENVPSQIPLYYGCFAWQVNMTWDPLVLNVTADYDPVFQYWTPRLTFGDFLVDQPAGTTKVNKINYAQGWFMFGETTKDNPSPPARGVAGSGWLATVEFEVVSEAWSVIDISSNYYVEPPAYPTTTLLDDDLNDIEMTPEDAYFVFIESPWQSDINEDGRIDIRDLAMVAVHYGEGPGYVGREDCSGETSGVTDGYVDIYDLAYVALDYGTQYYP